ncbi:MAG: NAD(P)H-hydrate dehydratase [Thermoplasmata archaeon]
MQPLIEFRVLDINSEYVGVSREKLMVNAGRALCEVVEENFPAKKIVVVCGPGNNGGDGFAMSAMLGKRREITVCLMERPEKIKSEITKKQFRNCRKVCGVETWENIEKLVGNAELIVDAIFGTGLNRPLSGKYVEVIEKINGADAPVLSVDVPSGFPFDTAVKPDITVTFHDIKEGMNEKNSGRIIVKDIGIPLQAEAETNFGEFALYKIPEKNSHKGENGRVLVIGGGPYTGAPFFVGLSAYRTGVDLVHIATTSEAYDVIRCYSPLFIVHRLPEKTAEALEFLLENSRKFNVCVIGPGIGNRSDIQELCAKFISNSEIPLVVDADAIKLLAKIPTKAHVLATPHAGEFFELTGEKLPDELEKRKEVVKKYAGKMGITILLKGEVDIISDGTHVKVNRTGNPGMTVGGTGDVLAGICAALIAKGNTPYQAARLGAFISGLAGDSAFEKYGYSLLPTDVIEAIPHVILDGLRRIAE